VHVELTGWLPVDGPGIVVRRMIPTPGNLVGEHRKMNDGAPRVAAARPRLSGRVLVVEDDPDIRAMTSSILRVAGATVCDASSAAEALSWLDRDDFDAVILDWNLAGETGRVLLEKLRERQPKLLRRSVVVTGDLSSIPGRHEAEHFGCPVLAKPFRPRQLVETLAGILALVD